MTAVSYFVVGSRHVCFARSPFSPLLCVGFCLYALWTLSVENLAPHDQPHITKDRHLIFIAAASNSIALSRRAVHGRAALSPVLEREDSIFVNNYIISIFRLAVADFFSWVLGFFSPPPSQPQLPPPSAPLLGKSSFTCTLNNAESVVIMIAEGQTYACQLM